MRRILSVVWALSPIALGVPAAPAFAWAAVRLQSRWLATAAVLYGAATVVFFMLASSSDPEVGDIGGGVGFGLMAVATTHALAIRRRVWASTDAEDTEPTEHLVALTAPPPGVTTRAAAAKDPSTWPLPFGCKVYDRHDLRLPMARLVPTALFGAALVVSSLVFDLRGRLLVSGIPLMVVPLLVAMSRQELDGPEYRWHFLGFGRTVRLDQATEVRIPARSHGAPTLELTIPGARHARLPLRTADGMVGTDVLDHVRTWLARPGVMATQEAAALLDPDTLAGGASPESQRWRRVAHIAMTLAAVSLLGVGVWLDRQEEEAARIDGAPGYVAGHWDGRALKEGWPWARPCTPVAISMSPEVPGWLREEIRTAVFEASGYGIPVYVGAGHPALSVEVDQVVKRLGENGDRFESMSTQYTTQAYRDGSIALVSIRTTLHLPVLEDERRLARRAARIAIAHSQGVDASDRNDSVLSSTHIHERFSAGDVAAMRVMAGCGGRPLG